MRQRWTEGRASGILGPEARGKQSCISFCSAASISTCGRNDSCKLSNRQRAQPKACDRDSRPHSRAQPQAHYLRPYENSLRPQPPHCAHLCAHAAVHPLQLPHSLAVEGQRLVQEAQVGAGGAAQLRPCLLRGGQGGGRACPCPCRSACPSPIGACSATQRVSRGDVHSSWKGYKLGRGQARETGDSMGQYGYCWRLSCVWAFWCAHDLVRKLSGIKLILPLCIQQRPAATRSAAAVLLHPE